MKDELGSRARSPLGSPRRVVILAFPGVNLLDLSGPAEVFSCLDEISGRSPYSVELASTNDDVHVRTSSGLTVAATRTVSQVLGPIGTLVVPGGAGVWEAAGDAKTIASIRELAGRAERIASVCTGSFLIAAAGLLDGLRATTHWRWCDRLREEYPAVTVEHDAIFVREGRISTSAGVTTGMDLTLSLVDEDLGRKTALEIARHLVLFVRRPGGQSQFSTVLEMQAAERRPLRELQQWLVDNLAEDLSVEALVSRAHMSTRNFARAFAREVGSTPARFVERLRIDAARRRLEESEAGLDQIARDCGFNDADGTRRSFLRVLRVLPSDYRNRFR